MPTLVSQTLLQNFVVEGVAQITRSDVDAMSTRLLEALEVRFKELQDNLQGPKGGGTADRDAPEITSIGEDNRRDDHRFKTWLWAGRWHMVPQGWVLPRPGLKDFFLLWHLGIPDQEIAPLKQLTRFDVSAPDWVQVSRARQVIAEVDSIARSIGAVGGDGHLGHLTAAELLRVFEVSVRVLLSTLYGESATTMVTTGMGIGTVYNKLTKKRKHAMTSPTE